MNKTLSLALLVLFLEVSLVQAQSFCQNAITSVATPSDAPIEFRNVYFQTVELGSTASANVRNVSEKPIEQFSVSLTVAELKGLSLSLAAFPGLPLSRQRELLGRGKSLDEIPHGDLRSPIGPRKEIFVHGGFGRAMANCPTALHISRIDVKFADHSWYHYKADEERYSAAETHFMPTILKGHPDLAENVFFCTILVDKTGKAKVESISSPRPEDQEVFQKIVSEWEFHPALMDQQPQEEKISVIVAIARSHVDFGKVKSLLAEHGPSVVMMIDKDPHANSWAVY